MLIHLKNCCQIQISPKCLGRNASWPYKVFTASWVFLLQIKSEERKSNKPWNRFCTKYQYFILYFIFQCFEMVEDLEHPLKCQMTDMITFWSEGAKISNCVSWKHVLSFHFQNCLFYTGLWGCWTLSQCLKP